MPDPVAKKAFRRPSDVADVKPRKPPQKGRGIYRTQPQPTGHAERIAAYTAAYAAGLPLWANDAPPADLFTSLETP